MGITGLVRLTLVDDDDHHDSIAILMTDIDEI
jgi:phosphate starvation-inducible membrane PsiE